MSKATIKAEIDANITQNGTGAITGNILNGVLNDMVDDYVSQEEITPINKKFSILKDVPVIHNGPLATEVFIEPGKTYLIYVKCATITAHDNRDGVYFYHGDTYDFVALTLAQIQGGTTIQFTPTQVSEVRPRIIYSSEGSVLNLQIKNYVENVVDYVEEKINPINFSIDTLNGKFSIIRNIPVTSNYPLDSQVFITPGRAYSIYVKCATITQADSLTGIYFWNDNNTYEFVQLTLAQIKNGVTIEHTPTQRQQVRPRIRYYSEGSVIELRLANYVENIVDYVDQYLSEVKYDVNPWKNKNVVLYGDSIVAQGNTSINSSFLLEAVNKLNLNPIIRGVGGQSFAFNNATFWAYADGSYAGRESQGGTQPAGTTTHKGAFSSWDRITTMIPAAIRETINLVIICGGTNDFGGVEEIPSGDITGQEPEWVANSQVDTDWAASSFYNGGDYDISKSIGGIASTIMKFRLWCPNAVVVLATPFPWFNTTTKMQKANEYGVTFRQWCETQMNVAKMIGCHIFDTNGKSEIGGYNYVAVQTDGVHPNELGRTLFGHSFVTYIKQLGVK